MSGEISWRAGPMKTKILAAIGETESSPKAALDAALAANDRLKYVFSLLQMAISHADHPDQPADSLKPERLAAGLDDEGLDAAIANASREGSLVRLPGAQRLVQLIATDLALMAAPLADEAGPRLAALLATLPSGTDDLLDPAFITAMTSGDRTGPDSAHRLVMDLHRRLNTVLGDIADETIDGAACSGLDAPDRDLVRAFMAGLNRTAGLKFDHPGLATTAARSAGRLTIQNDIGTTDAHVVVVHVADGVVSVTYSDIHAERLAFFQVMLEQDGFIWTRKTPATLGGGETFLLATAQTQAEDAGGCGAHLAWLASRLVFLIDWNRARKALRGLLRRRDRVVLLAWAAKSEIGHRGFLQMGGAGMVNRAIAEAGGSVIAHGDRLCDVLGDAPTMALLQDVLRITSDACLTGATATLATDRVLLALAGQFGPEAARRLAIAGDHAGLLFELACLARDAAGDAASGGHDGGARRGRRAAGLAADTQTLVARLAHKAAEPPRDNTLLAAVQAADIAARKLARAASPGAAIGDGPRGVADHVVSATQNWIRALGQAGQIGRDRNNVALDDFLIAIDALAGDARLIAASDRDPGTEDLRDAGAALAAAGVILRAHRLGELLRG
jgi:hypothetical protein